MVRIMLSLVVLLWSTGAMAEVPEERVRFLMEWIGDVTGYSTKDVEPPPILYRSKEEIQIIFYGDTYFEYQALENTKLMEISALYDNEAQIMYLDEAVDYTDPEHEPILVHELVHHLQEINGKSKGLTCYRALEPEAYKVQDLWVRATGKGERPNMIMVALTSQCHSGRT